MVGGQKAENVTQPKRLLVVAHDATLKATCVALLRHVGYDVAAVESTEDALTRLESERFDLVLVGRKSRGQMEASDVGVRERFPFLPILKIQDGLEPNGHATRSIDSLPVHVIEAVRELIGN